MKRLLLNASKFLLIAYAISIGISWVYTELFTRYKPEQTKRNWTLLRQGDTVDYATMGSSRVAHMIDVPLLNELTGKKGMNIATSGSSYADNYTLLTKYLQKNQVKTLVLNADEFCFHSTKGYHYPFADYEYMPYFFDDTINEVYKNNVARWKYYLWTVVPLSRYIEFNDRYEWSALLWINLKKPVCKFDTTAGTELLYNMRYKKFAAADTLPIVKNVLTVEKRDEFYFQKILSLCRSKGIKVILVTTPLFCKGIYAESNRTKFQVFIEALARKEKLPYINFYGVQAVQNSYYFRDMTHTNIQGTRIYTRYLASQLKDLL